MDALRTRLLRLVKSDEEKYLKTSRIILNFLGIWSERGSTTIMRITSVAALSIYLSVGVFSLLWPADQDVITFGVSTMALAAGFFNGVKFLWYSYNSKKMGWLVNELERISKDNVATERCHKIEFTKASNIADLFTVLLACMIMMIFGLETLYSVFISRQEYRVIFNLYSFIDPKRYYFAALCVQYFYIICATAGFIINFNLLLSFTSLIVANLSVLEKYLKSAPYKLNRSVNLHTDVMRQRRN